MKSTWDESYAIGLHVVDGQHKRLMQYFDQLQEDMKQGVRSETRQTTLDYLKIYANHHFAVEETFMEQTDYPFIDEHRDEHYFFMSKVAEFETKLWVSDPAMCIEMLQFLNTWILTHIKTTDAKLVPYLNEKGVDSLHCYALATKELTDNR